MTEAAPPHHTPQLSPTLVLGAALSRYFCFLFRAEVFLGGSMNARVCRQKIAARLMMNLIWRNRIKMIPRVHMSPGFSPSIPLPLILRPLHVRNCSDGRCFYTVFDLPALIQQESDSTTERQGPLLSRACNLPKTITTKGFRVSLPIIPTPVSGLTPLNGCASHILCYVHIQTRFVGLISVDVPLLCVNLFNIARE